MVHRQGGGVGPKWTFSTKMFFLLFWKPSLSGEVDENAEDMEEEVDLDHSPQSCLTPYSRGPSPPPHCWVQGRRPGRCCPGAWPPCTAIPGPGLTTSSPSSSSIVIHLLGGELTNLKPRFLPPYHHIDCSQHFTM